jgi:transitional endoplasmic reticulum ATPase
LAQSHILLHGEPGNGKTVLAEALAGELCIAFLEVTYGPVTSKWVGKLAALLTRTFALARASASASAPCVLFIDEIDSYLKSRDAQGSYAEMPVVTNVMLTEMVALCRTGKCSHSRSTG